MIYFIQSGESGPIKIGVADRPKQRLSQLQIGSHEPLFLLASDQGGKDEEMALHRRFASCALRGEWFSASPELLAFAANVASGETSVADEIDTQEALMLDIEAVAQRLGVSVMTVRRIVKAGSLPVYKIGGQLRFKETDIDAYIEGARMRPEDAEPTSAPIGPSLPPMIKALLAVLTPERTAVQEVYRAVGWERSQLEQVANTHRDLLRDQGVRLYPAVKEQAGGRAERYIEVTDADGVLKRYSAFSREVTP